jgi:two-component system sensor histidine kinase UhpB
LLNVTPLSKSGHGAVVSHQDITKQKLIEEEKVQLFEAVSQQSEQLRALTGRLVEVQELERKRLTQELHDQVGRNLTALGLNLNIIGAELAGTELESSQIRTRLNDSLALVEQTTESIRDVMADLRPPVLDDYGLVAALKWYGDLLASRADFSITIRGEEPAPRLNPPLENALFRISQEALTNAVKHAQATQLTVTVEADAETVRLVIADDGIGFEATHASQIGGRQSWGLLTMTERAEAVGGRCWIESVPGGGTRVIIKVPRGMVGERFTD